MHVKPKISYVIIMGDSLSDRGTMFNRLLFNFIPLKGQSGLEGKAPLDSFTNGLPWSDHFIAALAQDMTIHELKNKKFLDATCISDGVITRDARIYNPIRNHFDLGNDLTAKYRGHIFARTYIEGGLTADDHSLKSKKKFCYSIPLAITREILSTLEKKRQILLADDEKNKVTNQNKSQTLVIEWSGANDLITANAVPNKNDVDDAIDARMDNVNELIRAGYNHFVLFNLPDLSLTPRYQSKNENVRHNAKEISAYFNKRLKSEIKALHEKNQNCTIDLFDVNGIFLDIYHQPEKYKIDKEKLNKPYLNSEDFKINTSNHTSPATGYMFWDDVHPTADIHAIIASLFYERYKQLFKFSASRKDELKNLKAKDDFEIGLKRRPLN